mgnify:CR=1 FL=1
MSVYSVNVYPSSTTIKTGNWYYGAYAVVNASSNCNTGVRWYSNNTSVATVNASSGYIYAKSPGTTRIYAQSTVDSSKKDYITVTVTSGTICVDTVTLNRSSISLEKGDRYTLSATVCPTNATNKTISWRSSNTSVATVSGGVVTAKSRGYAYIYAEAQDGSGEYDYCYVNVTEDILVTSVTVSPSSMTMNIGNSAYLYETVCPTNATNKCVKWSSNKTSVATVNPDTGLVIARGVGTATITATVQDGSNKKGYCTITVNAPIRVTGVEVCPTSLTMNVGDIEYLCASITPYNATNQTVTWCSSNENVATVGLYTGRISANMAGTTTITATTADGGFTASCILTVIIDTVTIKKDGAFNKVVFNKSGKVWRCINQDMIFSDPQSTNYLIPRSNLNFYGSTQTTTQICTYTDDEIKLLYAIDPYGVADYVQRYAAEKDGLSGTLQEKDRIFRLLFNREPKYFARTLEGVWYEVDEYEEINDVLSESETIFGMHPVYDWHTFFEILGVCSSILNMVFLTNFFTSTVAGVIISKTVKTGLLIASGMESVLRREFSSYVAGNLFEKAVEKTSLEWALKFVSLYDSLDDLADAMNLDLNYNKQIIDYCACQTGYNVLFELKNGTIHNLNNVCGMLD